MLCFIYGFLIAGLAFFKPYESAFVGTMEGLMTATLCMICWGACMADLMYNNKRSTEYDHY